METSEVYGSNDEKVLSATLEVQSYRKKREDYSYTCRTFEGAQFDKNISKSNVPVKKNLLTLHSVYHLDSKTYSILLLHEVP